MSSGLKWCEWCYASLNVGATDCANCDSSSFIYQDPGKPKILREDAIKRREGKQYDLRPRTVISDAWDSKLGSNDSKRDGNSVLTSRVTETATAKQSPTLTPEEHAINAEIAELVTQIEILDRRLQELLNRKSPQIRKLTEERDRAITGKVAKRVAATSAAAAGISEAIGELFNG